MIDIILPENEEGADAVVLAWLKQVGEIVKAHEPVLEISTDKVTMEVAAPVGGVLQECLVKPDETITPGTVLGRIADLALTTVTDAQTASPIVDELAPILDHERELDQGQRHRLSPLVKRMLQEHQLDVATIDGSGRGGRVTGKDVKAYLAHSEERAPAPVIRERGENEFIPHSPMRRQIAQHMVQSMLKTAPHVTSLFEADLSAIIAHRSRHKEEFASRGVKLTFTSYFTYAAVQAMYAAPEVNSRWHEDGLEVFKEINMGIATALGASGLIVPVIKDAQNLGLFGIARELGCPHGTGSDGYAPPVGCPGRNVYHYQSRCKWQFTRYANHQPAAVRHSGNRKMDKRVVVREVNGQDTMQILPMIYVTLTIDHRALDGFSGQYLSVSLCQCYRKLDLSNAALSTRHRDTPHRSTAGPTEQTPARTGGLCV